ncbi:MAG: hypothetical protein F6K16_30535 [Symploca sp. SIO2B6]|nr:hypothetical protein [Symploca sp. SIO2B6]
MARYTSVYKSGDTPVDHLRHCLAEILQSCNFDVIYEDNDYLVAKETPGGVSFAKLVTVEVLFGKTSLSESAVDSALHMSVVVKNEELPLNINNHCRQQFNRLNRVVSSNHQVQLIESAA